MSDDEDNAGMCTPTKKLKRYTIFNSEWENESDFKNWVSKEDDYTVKCRICSVTFSVKYEGRRALKVHMESQKHKTNIKSQHQKKTIQSFFATNNTRDEDAVVKAELISIFHNVKHGHSYNSLDCQNKLYTKMFPDSKTAIKIACGRTKSTAIVNNVLGPHAQNVVVDDLKKSPFFAVLSDASNVRNIKTFPYAVQYFNPGVGVCQRLLDFYQDPKETSTDIFNEIKGITESNGLKLQQISAYSADNASVNYGKHNSVFVKLKTENPNIIKANCNCHVINNCVKYASKLLPYDIEAVVIKMYNEFSSSAVKSDLLKEFAEFAEIEYKELLRHVPTRWLTLYAAIDRLVHCWPAVKSYFLSKGEDDCSRIIWAFVAPNGSDSDSQEIGFPELYLHFLHNILPVCDAAVRQLESDSCSSLDLDQVMRKLFSQIETRLQDKFYGAKVSNILCNFLPAEKETFSTDVAIFLQRCLNYLSKNYDFNDTNIFTLLSCLSLRKGQTKELPLKWDDLMKLCSALKISVDMDKLYSDYCDLRIAYPVLGKDNSNSKIWMEFFSKHEQAEELLKLVSFSLSIPVSNAYAERIFSVMGSLWTKERNRMSMELVKSELQIRHNLDYTCAEFAAFLGKEDGRKIVNAAKKDGKYSWKK